jgi:hypothetical protein
VANEVTGGCLCGAYRYSFDRDQVITAHHCHCKDCQKSTGSGKATFVMLPAAVLQEQGELASYTVTGTDGSHIARGFCQTCGSPVASYIEEMPDLRLIKAGSLDESDWINVSSSFWSCSARSWSPVDSTIDSVEKNPAM